ncbi:MAG: hypothetical protein PHY47_21815 [Lachnospiraceae bacterium]|nr:hypothetical protein [Lachnospiraceae bacterium]MDD4249024.1 hypothetical protein [Methanosarcina sp.]
MKRIDPHTFRGPRAYVTDFDPIIFRFENNKEEYLKETERRLKITLLTKSTVVCAASHLTNEFIYPIFRDNPILLRENMIIPALRKDKEQIRDYFDDGIVKYSLKENISDFYEKNIKKTVSWELYENTNWFKENMLKALKEETSVLRRNLPNLSKLDLISITTKIEDSDILRREDLIDKTLNWPSLEKTNILNYSIMLYHMSGARVVNCESSLPIEHYIDYNLSDFTRSRTLLSDTQVFLKIFWELGLNKLQGRQLPVERIDSLSFEDICDLRKPIEKTSFREKYDEIIQTSIQSVGFDSERENFINGMERTYETFIKIQETFDEVFDQEFNDHFNKMKKQPYGQLLYNSASFAIGVIGFIPTHGLSQLISASSLIKPSREIFTNWIKVCKNKEEKNYYEFQLKEKRKVANKLIKKFYVSKSSPFLDIIDLMNNVIVEEER